MSLPTPTTALDGLAGLAARSFASTAVATAAILALVTEQLGLRTSFLTRFDLAGGRTTVLATHHRPGGCVIAAGTELPLANTFSSLIAGSVEPLLIGDTRRDPAVRGHPAAAVPNLGSFIGVPIVLADGTLFGTLGAVDPDPQALTSSQADLLVVLARLLATNIERDRELTARQQAEEALRRAHDALERRVRERTARLALLGELGRELGGALEFDHFLATAWRQLTRVAGTADCWVGRWDAAAETMHYLLYVADGHRHPDRERPLPLHAGSGLSCTLVTERTTIRTPDYVAECRRRGLAPSGPLAPRPGLAWLGVPLLSGGRAVGALAVWRFAAPFGAEDAATLEALAGHMAAALENARLYAEARRLAATDPLTGVANRRHVQERLAQELARAARQGQPLAVALLDLDGFKAINDTHGHAAGDAALQAIAVLLRAESRAGDVVGRYGGDEFLLVLPDSTRADALAWLDRVRQRLLLGPWPDRCGQGTDLSVALSAGVAVYPDEATDQQALIQLADRALYANKRVGSVRDPTD